MNVGGGAPGADNELRHQVKSRQGSSSLSQRPPSATLKSHHHSVSTTAAPTSGNSGLKGISTGAVAANAANIHLKGPGSSGKPSAKTRSGNHRSQSLSSHEIKQQSLTDEEAIRQSKNHYHNMSSASNINSNSTNNVPNPYKSELNHPTHSSNMGQTNNAS